ncbi:MAG: hypothetical protein HYV76_00045 [Candidatus Vogelbacteria bacterium]|nr:hypothetical protein [Candidatus Vogelbacteria bacterium]
MSKLLSAILLVLAFVVAMPIALADWTAPIATPPTCATGSPGCDAPINVSANDQIKAGSLKAGVLGVGNNLSSWILQNRTDAGLGGAFNIAKINNAVSLGNFFTIAATSSSLGNIGIGTIWPVYKLHLYGSNPTIALQALGGNAWGLRSWSDGNFYINDLTNNNAAGAGTRMRIETATGNVVLGLGSKPNAALELGGSISGKEPNAGKLGYNLFTGQGEGIDIVGGGPSVGAREVRIWDNLQVCNPTNSICTDVVGGGGGSSNWEAISGVANSLQNKNTGIVRVKGGRLQVTGNANTLPPTATGSKGLELGFDLDADTPTGGQANEGVLTSMDRSSGAVLQSMRYNASQHRFLVNDKNTLQISPNNNGNAGFVRSTGRIQVTGNAIPANGKGLELGFLDNEGVITTRDIDANPTFPSLLGTRYNGTYHTFQIGGVDAFKINSAGNIGVGTSVNNPSAKLDIGGNIRIADGTQGAGKVLTSNANGVASWQDPTGGGLPTGTTDQTLRHNGTSWVANNFLKSSANQVNIGMGVDTASTVILGINGKVQILGGDPGSGKVLTSDASGVASWQTPTGGTPLPPPGPNGDVLTVVNNIWTSQAPGYIRGGHYGYGRTTTASYWPGCYDRVNPMSTSCSCPDGFTRYKMGKETINPNFPASSYDNEFYTCIKN